MATIDDAEKLALLGSETFWQAYRSESALEAKYIRAYMARAFSVQQLTAELNCSKTEFVLASKGMEDIGYAKLVFGNSHESLSGKKPMEIARIYVSISHWRKGIGSELLSRCFELARSAGCDSVWLGVWRSNKRAISFYEKHHFKIVGVVEFDLASSLQKDHVMERVL